MVNITLADITNALVNGTNTLVNGTNTPLINASLASNHKSAFIQSILNPQLAVFVLSVSAVVVIMIIVVKNVIPVSHFLYANARIQARSNSMVTNQSLLELTEAKSLKEFRSLLRETTYGEELEKAEEGLRPFHAALEKGSTEAVLELVEMSPEKSRQLFEAYLMFLESKILKVIYRAKIMKQGIDESLVYAIGNIDQNMLNRLLETETAADIGVVMAPTNYAGIFDNKYNNLEEFETALDGFVFNNFVTVTKKIKMHDEKAIIEILNKKVDILNILALLKFRIRGIEKEKQKTLLVNNKTDICLRFDKIIDAETLKDFIEKFKGLSYFEPLIKAFEKYEKDNALVHFENELYRFFKQAVVKNDMGHTLGPYPLFSYLIKREVELRNLFIISRGIDAKFSTEKIRGMII